VAVGNLTVGGTGKTPLVELLCRALEARGRQTVILSLGYGRRESEPVAAVSDRTRLLLDPREAGDEPYLLARRLSGIPVVVGRDRFRAGAWAVARFRPDVLVLDDGFQQRRLRKDVEVVCLDARAPWGSGQLLPRGSLREPRTALARADLIVLTHVGRVPDLPRIRAEVRRWVPSQPVALAAFEAEGVEEQGSGAVRPVDALRGTPLLAFAGIASPGSFAATLDDAGVAPRALVEFPDHHPYKARDLGEIESQARAVGARALLTTEKDLVRLPLGARLSVWALRVRLTLSEVDEGWWPTLERRLDRA